MTQRVETTRKAAEEEAKEKADAARLAADDQQKMGEIALAAAKEHQALLDSGRRISIQAQIAEQVQATNAKYALELTAMSQELAGLDTGAKDYENKQGEILNRQKQPVQQYENKLTAIREKAEIERNGRILSAEQRFNDTIASGLTQSLMGHKSFAAEFTSIGNTVVTGMMQNAIKSVMANDFTKESDAAAARKAFLAGWHFLFPANIIAAPVMGAAAFAAVMAFQDGTDSVPGSGKGDKVPAMLEPGEGVVPGGVMDNLRKMSSSGEMGGNHYHVRAHFAPTVHALDADGVDTVLDKHADKFQKHFENAVRRMNR